jgi:hypothetical protein
MGIKPKFVGAGMDEIFGIIDNAGALWFILNWNY